MMPNLTHLLFASCIFLFGFALSATLLLRSRKRLKLYAVRVDAVVRGHRTARPDAAPSGLGLRRSRVTLASRAAALLRYDASRRATYPAPLPLVLALALLVSLVLARAAVEFTGLAGWAAAPLACVLLGRKFYGWCEDRFLATLYNQFPDALAMVVRAVRVGLPVVEAIRVVAQENPEPTAAAFTGLVAQSAIGVPLEDALREMADRTRLPEYRFFATALSLQSQTGGGLTETLENLADTIRKRVAARIRGHALAAEARMSSYILGGLPLVTGGLLSIMNPDYMSVLFTDPSGRKLLLFGILLLGIGAFSMRALIRKSLA